MPFDFQTHDQVFPFLIFLNWHVYLICLAAQWILLTKVQLHIVNRHDVRLVGLFGGQDLVPVDRTSVYVEPLEPDFHGLEWVVEGYFDAGERHFGPSRVGLFERVDQRGGTHQVLNVDVEQFGHKVRAGYLSFQFVQIGGDID